MRASLTERFPSIAPASTRLAAWQYVPRNDLVNQLVCGEDGTGVDSVLIGGRLVLRHGQLVGVDVTRLRARLQESVGRLAETNAEMRALTERVAPFVSSYCQGLTSVSAHAP